MNTNRFNDRVPVSALLGWYVLPRKGRGGVLALFIILSAGFILSLIKSVRQWFALVLVMHARFGWWGAFVSCLFCFVLFVPPVFYYSLLKSVPRLWMMPDAPWAIKAGFSAGMCVLYPLLSLVLFWVYDALIAWIRLKVCAPGTAFALMRG